MHSARREKLVIRFGNRMWIFFPGCPLTMAIAFANVHFNPGAHLVPDEWSRRVARGPRTLPLAAV